jgi:hypothetical protein
LKVISSTQKCTVEHVLDEKEKNIMPICGGKNGFGQAYVPRMF